MADSAVGEARTALFARYSLAGALFAALGALAVALPAGLAAAGMDRPAALRSMFALYGGAGFLVWWIYRGMPDPPVHEMQTPPQPLGISHPTVIRLAALFSVDAFAGGLVVHSLLALWLFLRFDLSLATAGQFFFWAGLATAFSQLAAPWVAGKTGLPNTMVFTHLPSSVFLILAAFASNLPVALGLLLLRAALSQMDVPTRSAFVMAVVAPPERAAARASRRCRAALRQRSAHRWAARCSRRGGWQLRWKLVDY